MRPKISPKTVSRLKILRSQGWSIPELKKKFKIGHGTVFRYVKNTEILSKYKDKWLSKRKSSVSRMNQAREEAKQKAEKHIRTLNKKELILALTSLYWAEGGKRDLSFINSDPEMVQFFVSGLTSLLDVPRERIRINIRIYEDMDVEICKKFWLQTTKLDESSFGKVNVIYGKKQGKLKYGMCRVRVLKGGFMLKYLTAVRERLVLLSPRSSMDRTEVS